MFDDLRSAWNARRPTKEVFYWAPADRTEFYNHWDGGALGLLDKAHDACLAKVRQIQADHQAQGWSDIGYNGLICPHGRAIEGRGIDYVGAHCPDHNRLAYGWQFMVGEGEVATPAMLARMQRAYKDCCDHSHRTLLKRGHRDGFATACPGDQIYTWVKAGMPAPTTEEDDMPAPKDLWDYQITLSGKDGKPFTASAAAWLSYTNQKVTTMQATLAALTAAVKALAEAKGADSAAITQAVVDKINALELSVSVKE